MLGVFRRRGVTARRHLVVIGMSIILLGVLYVSVAVGYGVYVGAELAVPEVRSHAVKESTDVIASEVVKVLEVGASKAATERLKSWPALYRNPTDGISSAPRTALYGNKRAVIPLLLTSMKYHGTSLLATTLQGWILKFLIPQGNIDLIIFYDAAKVKLEELVTVLRIKKRPQSDSSASVHPDLLVDVRLAPEEAALLGDGYFLSAYHPTYSFRVHPVQLPFPDYIAANLTLLDNPSWLRCGCPPVCPLKRATVDYVQGTRWYTYDLFLQPIVREYSFWVKLDVDIWMMREVPFNMAQTLIDAGAVFAHTGYIYNGNGCSDELHKAIRDYLAAQQIQAVSAGQRWWEQDDNVYYSNFVISSMAFHLSSEHLRLAKALTEYPTGFFKYRWTDQSLFHKVFGVFFGPQETDFLLDWTNLRCSKKAYRKGAVFYHSKGKKKSSVLRMCTDI